VNLFGSASLWFRAAGLILGQTHANAR